MKNTSNVLKGLEEIPTNYELVNELIEQRNKKKVIIIRYQNQGIYLYNGPRIIEVMEDNHLVSFKNLSETPEGKLLSIEQAKSLAEKIFHKLVPTYAKGLTFMRIEQQKRSFMDENSVEQTLPVQWIKFAHRNGSYNWVTLGAKGKLIEMEIDSRWDYFHGRRQTEMWDNDDWVLAREGKEPQLPSPNALA
ncbi:YcdB/YcdC domain-containing protein [Enterococcus sp. H57]|uniref:YcdB/YcdC domain-containing protein n=1 Tax=Enterococcus sp. H57 TaxID=2035004 RepID=UPI000D58F89F|nr:YcdB/YcdC domain-containing protein [Enterococcus sp. H57]EMF0571573.1 hypothetical protein [Enterococcus faecium]NTK90354.1 hypothetical protein [Enterococcus faecium]